MFKEYATLKTERDRIEKRLAELRTTISVELGLIPATAEPAVQPKKGRRWSGKLLEIVGASDGTAASIIRQYAKARGVTKSAAQQALIYACKTGKIKRVKTGVYNLPHAAMNGKRLANGHVRA